MEVKPRLVIEYVPGGNLADQHADSPIAGEEIVVVLYQCLEGLDYLHSENVTHGDIKPENILIPSRTPMSAKLSDFGLARQKTVLQTWCGTLEYCAPEFFENQTYSSKVDIWSLGIVVFKYAYGLPAAKKRRRVRPEDQEKHDRKWGIKWCKRIDDATEDWDTDKLIGLLRGTMLRWDPFERSSARLCMEKGSEKGVFNDAFDATGNRTPTIRPVQLSEPADEDASTFMMGPLWLQDRSPDVGRSGSCTRVLDCSVHNHESTSGGGGYSSTSQGPPVRSAKRRRTGQGNQSLIDRHVAERVGGPVPPIMSTTASLVPGKQHQLPSLPPNEIATCNGLHQPICFGIDAKNQNSQEPTGTQVDDIFDSYVEITVRGKLVLMRKSDASLNAVQILNLVQSATGRHSILEFIEGDDSSGNTKNRLDGFWVSFETGRSLCQILGLSRELQPLVDLCAGGQTVAAAALDPSGRGKYFSVEVDGRHITGRWSDFWINATQILRASGDKKHQAGPMIRTLYSWMRVENVTGSGKVTGTYVSFLDGLLLCRDKELPEFRALLLRKFITWLRFADSEHALDWNLTHYLVRFRQAIVAVRKTDFWINSSHLLKAAGLPRNSLRTLKQEIKTTYDVVRGCQGGAYVAFPVGLDICERLNLHELRDLLLGVRGLTPQTEGNCDGLSNPNLSSFRRVFLDDHNTVTIDLKDSYVNITELLKALGRKKGEVRKIKESDPSLDVRPVKGGAYKGTYMDFAATCILFKNKYDHPELAGFLEALKSYIEVRRETRASMARLSQSNEYAELQWVATESALDETMRSRSLPSLTPDETNYYAGLSLQGLDSVTGQNGWLDVDL